MSWALPDRDGPLLAVAGLCGGAGASTLAHTIAASAAATLQAEGRPAAVLLCDAGESAQGVALYSGVRSRRSLLDTARRVADERGSPGELFAVGEDGLRVIAGSGTPYADDRDGQALSRLVEDARQAHGLTVVDCGTLALVSQRVALARATHVAWVLPATRLGLRRAEAGWPDLPTFDRAAEMVVARADSGGRRAKTRALGRLASSRGATLLLMPELGEAAEGGVAEASEILQVPIQAIAARLAR